MKKRYLVGVITTLMVACFAPICLATGFENIAPMAIIPEPASGLLLAAGGLILLKRRNQR